MRTDQHADVLARGAMTEGAGQNPAEYVAGAWVCPWNKEVSDPQTEALLEGVVASENMKLAWKQVKRNKGVAGLDGRDIEETERFLRKHWSELRRQLLEGSYKPFPVLRVEIPKPNGKTRPLGIPTVCS